jgi:hypothetical protein
MPNAKKKTSFKNDSGRVNKSAWIRSQPKSLSAKEVADKAKAEGIKLSLAQVYTARSTAKREGDSKSGNAAPRRGPGRPKGSPVSASSSDLRRQFVQLAVRVGTDEAQRLLDRIVDVEANG